MEWNFFVFFSSTRLAILNTSYLLLSIKYWITAQEMMLIFKVRYQKAKLTCMKISYAVLILATLFFPVIFALLEVYFFSYNDNFYLKLSMKCLISLTSAIQIVFFGRALFCIKSMIKQRVIERIDNKVMNFHVAFLVLLTIQSMV